MPRINLLPWRTELRQRRKKEFFVLLLGGFAAAALVVWFSSLAMQSWISSQQGRNSLLKDEIAKLDETIKKIADLETQRDRRLARMRIIDRLQTARPEVVHLFDELVDTLPEGLHLTEISQQGTRIQIKGAAQSSTRVSALMNNINDSQWLKAPELAGISYSQNDSPTRDALFTLSAQQVSLADTGEDTIAEEQP